MVLQKATLLLFTLRFKMINLKVSEAYAFDYLAILQIKCEMDPSTNFEAYSKCVTNLIDELKDNKKWTQIMDSIEYRNLYEINFQTFQAVDDAKEDGVKASYVDRCNYKRFLAKKALQEKFFPEEKLSENKIGYSSK